MNNSKYPFNIPYNYIFFSRFFTKTLSLNDLRKNKYYITIKGRFFLDDNDSQSSEKTSKRKTKNEINVMKSKGNSKLIIKSLQFDTFYASKISPYNLSSRFNYFPLMKSL